MNVAPVGQRTRVQSHTFEFSCFSLNKRRFCAELSHDHLGGLNLIYGKNQIKTYQKGARKPRKWVAPRPSSPGAKVGETVPPLAPGEKPGLGMEGFIMKQVRG